MWLLSDDVLFPVATLALWALAILVSLFEVSLRVRDRWVRLMARLRGWRRRVPGSGSYTITGASVDLVVTRGEASMATLVNIAGFAMVVITLTNQSAFQQERWFTPYSALINVVDVIAVLYVCFGSPTTRNWIIGVCNHAHTERR